MSKPVVFALLGMALYAVLAVVLEQRLARYNNLTLICVFTPMVLAIVVVARQIMKGSDPSFDFPVGWDLAIVLALGIVLAAADYCYVGAYTNGGDLFTITCIAVLMPVFASVLKFAWTMTLPNLWQVGGYVLAAGAVLLIAKGSTS
ncbi:MAG: hypothetical protein Q7S95_01375 [bacterium]|nr:hypothetical protein [bacterium]